MIDIMKAFYSVHYNFAALSILIILLIIFFITKKNYKGVIIAVVVVVALNLAIYKRTDGRIWTLEDTSTGMVIQFAAASERYPWTYEDEKTGEILHWCWFEDYWEAFASISLVDKLWGSKQAESARKSSENRASDIGD